MAVSTSTKNQPPARTTQPVGKPMTKPLTPGVGNPMGQLPWQGFPGFGMPRFGMPGYMPRVGPLPNPNTGYPRPPLYGGPFPSLPPRPDPIAYPMRPPQPPQWAERVPDPYEGQNKPIGNGGWFSSPDRQWIIGPDGTKYPNNTNYMHGSSPFLGGGSGGIMQGGGPNGMPGGVIGGMMSGMGMPSQMPPFGMANGNTGFPGMSGGNTGIAGGANTSFFPPQTSYQSPTMSNPTPMMSSGGSSQNISNQNQQMFGMPSQPMMNSFISPSGGSSFGNQSVQRSIYGI